MGFWWFKKKSDQEATEVQVAQVFQDNLRSSFSHIKSDIQVLRDWLSSVNDKDLEKSRKMKELECRLDELGEVIAYMQKSQDRLRETVLRLDSGIQKRSLPLPEVETTSSLKNQKTVPKEEAYYPEDETVSSTVFESLTETQNLLFLKLGALLRESGQERILFKTLAQEAYPGKDYGAIRSTISEYLDILAEFGLVNKTRRGKSSYVQLTKKGKEHLSKQKQPAEKKIMRKEERK